MDALRDRFIDESPIMFDYSKQDPVIKIINQRIKQPDYKPPVIPDY